MQGWDFVTEELGGKEGLRDRYYGPPSASQTQDRRHIVVVNYSYRSRTRLGTSVAQAPADRLGSLGRDAVHDREPLDPTCNTNLSGIKNSDPSLTGCSRADATSPLRADGEPLFSGYTPDPNMADAFQPHFNPAAFRRPQPNGARATSATRRRASCVTRPGRTGTSRWRVAFPSRAIGRGGSVRVQPQIYNMWNAVEFTTMDATVQLRQPPGTLRRPPASTRRSNNPLNVGLTFRFDF